VKKKKRVIERSRRELRKRREMDVEKLEGENM
jgi:hypothetical protein